VSHEELSEDLRVLFVLVDVSKVLVVAEQGRLHLPAPRLRGEKRRDPQPAGQARLEPLVYQDVSEVGKGEKLALLLRRVQVIVFEVHFVAQDFLSLVDDVHCVGRTQGLRLRDEVEDLHHAVLQLLALALLLLDLTRNFHDQLAVQQLGERKAEVRL